jgi:single-strand DNA-binding protein
VRNLNRIVLTGGLTRDPELRRTTSGTAVATLRVGYTTQRKQGGEWHERPNYIDVELWGARAESAARHLRKGRQIAVDGRLEWREYETRRGERRQVHSIVADSVEFLGGRVASEPQAEDGDERAGDAVAAAGPAVEDEIPF